MKGEDFSYLGLGFAEPDFKTFDKIDETLNDFNNVSDKFRAFEASLASELNIIQSRQDYTRATINTLQSGSDDLVYS